MFPFWESTTAEFLKTKRFSRGTVAYLLNYTPKLRNRSGILLLPISR